MGTISYSLPVSGQPDATEEPKVTTALQTLLTWANGGVDTNNLSPTAGITASQLALGAARLNPVVQNTNASTTDGNLYLVGTAGITLTLPSVAAGTTIEFVTYGGVTGASPLTIQRAGGATINGLGVSAATSIVLGSVGAFVRLWTDGSNWFISGGVQDTGWAAISYAAGVNAANGYTVAWRLIGDRVWLRGAADNTTGGAITAIFASSPAIPAAARPAQRVNVPFNTASGVGLSLQIASSGIVTVSNPGLSSGDIGFLDGASYSLV